MKVNDAVMPVPMTDCLRAMSEHDIGFCLTDFSGGVLCQNALAAQICGGCVDERVCRDPQFSACRQMSLRSEKSMGTYHYANQTASGEQYDVYVVNNGRSLARFMYSLTEKYAREMREFEPYTFTKAQASVLQRLVQRATTGAIARELGVSEETIRSHIKAIYRKISPASRQALKHIRLEKSRSQD